MTHKDQAEKLVDRFSEYSHTDFNYSRGGYQADTQIQNAKQCALIALQYLLEESEYTDSFYERCHNWEKVKQEIEKL